MYQSYDPSHNCHGCPRVDMTPREGWLSQDEVLLLHRATLLDLGNKYPGLTFTELEALTVATMAANERIGC